MSDTLSGKVTNIVCPRGGFYFNSCEWSLFSMLVDGENKVIRCSGNSFALYKGLQVIVTGEMKKTPYGDTFVATEIRRDLSSSSSLADLVKVICGPTTGQKVIDKYGDAKTALGVIKDHPDWLYGIRGIKDAKIKRILANYSKNESVEKAYEELKTYGFSIDDALKIVKTMGIASLGQIKADPYILMFKAEFGFKKCDEIALRQGKAPSCEPRVVCGLYQALRDARTNGDTYMQKDGLIREAGRVLQLDDYVPDRGLLLSVLSSSIQKGRFIESDGNVYTKKSFREESDIRSFVLDSLKKGGCLPKDEKAMASAITEYEAAKGFTLGPEQKEAVANSLTHRISIITGGPGTGKTTILDCILKIASKAIDPNHILLCAPTGKAARRMSEATGLPAFTIHSALRVDPTKPNLETFQFNSENKLPYQLIVIDESSMIDQFILASLLRAMKASTQVIFVGDKDQLPPVGAGYSFRDLMRAGVATVKLIETYRQAGDSTIIKFSRQVNSGKIESVANVRKDFGFLHVDGTADIVEVYMRGYCKVGVDDIVVLSPQKEGPFGTKAINAAILDHLIPKKENDKEISRGGWRFREGCRVIQLRNNNELGVVNGQIGTIESIDMDTKTAIVDFDGEKLEYTSDMFDDLALGYAITVHKSQGSEWKYVIEVVSKTHCMNTRPLVYTAVTRAKKALIIVGDIETLLEAPERVPREIKSRIV